MTALHPTRTATTSPAPAPEPTDDSQSGIRTDLLGYAAAGGFTLSADTHAWYAAVDAVAGPEEARAASTVLAELRARDLPATRALAARLSAETTLGGELTTVAAVTEAVSLLLRVRATLVTLSPAAYAADELATLVAATAPADRRRQEGVTLSWGRRFTLGRAARRLAVSRPTRRADLHEALRSALAERTEWAARAGSDARSVVPALPQDGTLLDTAVQSVDAMEAGLRELGRLLADRELATLTFDELADLVDRLAADEGTLFRLPTLRAARESIEAQGFGELLRDLTEQQADAEAVAAACDRLLLSDEAPDLVPAPRAAAAPVTTAAPQQPAGAEIPAQAAPAAADAAVPAPEAEALPEESPEAEEAQVAAVEALPEASAEVAAEVPAETAVETAVEGDAEEAPEELPEAVAEVSPEAEAPPEAKLEALPEAVAEVAPEVSLEVEAEELPEAVSAEVEPVAAVEEFAEVGPEASAEELPEAVSVEV
ncbi:hypothetical protein ABH925_007356, partial [Streptacidiphilus sp. EB129]